MTQATRTEPSDLAQRVVDELSDRQVDDIALVDVSKVSGLADFFVIGTAGNERQMQAVMDALDRDLGIDAVCLRALEGNPDSGWVLLDFGDVVVQLFSPEQRAFYRLDDLWYLHAPVVRFT